MCFPDVSLNKPLQVMAGDSTDQHARGCRLGTFSFGCHAALRRVGPGNGERWGRPGGAVGCTAGVFSWDSELWAPDPWGLPWRKWPATSGGPLCESTRGSRCEPNGGSYGGKKKASVPSGFAPGKRFYFRPTVRVHAFFGDEVTLFS